MDMELLVKVYLVNNGNDSSINRPAGGGVGVEGCRP